MATPGPNGTVRSSRTLPAGTVWSRRTLPAGTVRSRHRLPSAGSARPLRRSDDGAIHVVEALLAGMIILTAVMFLTNVSKPSPPAAEAGIDLEGVARDVLGVLENRPPTDRPCEGDTPDPDCYPSRLEQVTGSALGYSVTQGQQATSNSDTTGFLDQVIPIGNRWLLRLDNGVEPLVLLPDSGSNVQLTPRAAKAAETFIVPAWQENAGSSACGDPPATAPFTPGGPEGAFDVQPSHSLVSPTGSVWPASSASWTDWWIAQQERFQTIADADPESGIPVDFWEARIPPTALYGWWVHEGDCRFIGLPDDAATDYPVYGVQLVVWPIAG